MNSLHIIIDEKNQKIFIFMTLFLLFCMCNLRHFSCNVLMYIDCAISWYKNACIKTLIIEMEGQLTTQGCPLPHFVHFFLHTVLSSFFQYSSMQINPTVYSLHLIINEKKGMECLTNMKKELMRN